MPHEHLSRNRHLHLIVALVCLVFVGQAISGPVVSAEPGAAPSAQTPRAWSEPAVISDQLADSDYPDIAVCTDGTVYVVWEEDRGEREHQIWFRVFHPSTGRWDQAKPVQIQDTGFLIAYGSQPAIAVSADCVTHLVWTKLWGLGSDIFHARGDENGNGFVSQVRVSSTDETQSLQPDVAVDSNGEPYAVWVERISGSYRVYWGAPIPDHPEWPFNNKEIEGADGQAPALAVDHHNRLHLAWMQADALNLPAEVFYKWQERAGEWTPWSNNISESSGDDSRAPGIALSNNRLAITWQETVSNDAEVFVRSTQLDGSYNFTGPHNLSNTHANSRSPALAADGIGRFFVVWDEDDPTNAVLTRSWGGSGEWDVTGSISDIGIKVKHPAVAASSQGSHVYAVWAQKDGPEDTWDIYFSETEVTIYRSYLTLLAKMYEP